MVCHIFHYLRLSHPRDIFNPSDVKNILFHQYFNFILLTNGYAFEEMEMWGFFLPLNFVAVVRASEDCARSFRGLQPPLIFYSFNPHTHIETRCNFRICFVRIYLIFDIVSENFTNTEKLKYFCIRFSLVVCVTSQQR